MNINPSLVNLLKKQAEKSPSTYRIGGIAFSNKGNILGTAYNAFRAERLNPGRGIGRHCEATLIRKYGHSISTILIMRIGNGGDILPIEPCAVCKKLADKFGIKIVSIKTSN